MIRAVIFDMDGVLIDACRIHRDTLRQALAAKGYREYDEVPLEGLPTRVKLERLGVESSLRPVIEAHKQRLTLKAASEAPLDLGTAAVLDTLRSRGYLLGCYTNSISRTARSFLANAGLLSKFDHVVTNEDVSNPKPSPDGYLRCMSALGVQAKDTVIVEDSAVGLKAAYASGAYVLAVRDPPGQWGDDLFQFLREVD